MNSLLSSYEEAFIIVSEESSLSHLLTFGLQCFGQGRYAEGIICAALENLLPALQEKTAEPPVTQVGPEKIVVGNQLLHLHQAPPSDLNQEKPSTPSPMNRSEEIRDDHSLPPLRQISEEGTDLPALYATCFGRFEVSRRDKRTAHYWVQTNHHSLGTVQLPSHAASQSMKLNSGTINYKLNFQIVTSLR